MSTAVIHILNIIFWIVLICLIIYLIKNIIKHKPLKNISKIAEKLEEISEKLDKHKKESD